MIGLNIRSHFIITQQIVPGLINGLINGGIAWAIYHTSALVGLWDHGAYGTDLLATGFLMPAITWPILRSILSRQVAKGKAPIIDGMPTPWLARFMPNTLWGGVVVIGLIGMLIFGGAIVAVMQVLAPSFDGNSYAVLKGLYAMALTIALQPVMVFAVLDQSCRIKSRLQSMS